MVLENILSHKYRKGGVALPPGKEFYMAKYHKNLQYHEDTVEKHMLTAEELRFLLELQKEMNTQDNVGQADPRFWVIKGTEKEYGIEIGYEDGAELWDEDGCCTAAVDMESAAGYIRDILLDEINDIDGVKRKIELLSDGTIRVSWNDCGMDDEIELENMEETAGWLKDQGFDYCAVNYKNIEKIYPDTMFLTQKAAEEHLRANDYHYPEDAHTYARTAWRSPETKMLWKIIKEVDWNQLLMYLRLAAKDCAECAEQQLPIVGT